MGKFLTEEEKSSQPKVTPALLKRIFSYLMPYKLQLALVLGCIVVSSFFTLLPSILTGKILDEGLLKGDLNALVRYILLSLLVTFLANLIGLSDHHPDARPRSSGCSAEACRYRRRRGSVRAGGGVTCVTPGSLCSS